MLAVFGREVAPSPEGLRQPGEAGGGAEGLAAARRGHRLPRRRRRDGATRPTTRAPSSPGAIENIAVVKQQYGLSKGATEVNLVIEAYRTLRDQGPYPEDQVMGNIGGKFASVLYDRSTSSIFMAADADGSVPFYWGVDSEGLLVVSDDAEILKNACGKSFAPFPKGFFFSKGEVCSTTYAVDAQAKKDIASIPRVGSAADWSSQY